MEYGSTAEIETNPRTFFSTPKVAIIVAEGFEQSDVAFVSQALEARGAELCIVGICGRFLKAWNQGNWDQKLIEDSPLNQFEAEDFDALYIPGGVLHTQQLSAVPEVIQFIRDFLELGKPIAAFGHGPQLLLQAEGVRERRLTSDPSLKEVLSNAGAEWLDACVIADNDLITGRATADLEYFTECVVDALFGLNKDAPEISLRDEARLFGYL